MPPPSPSADEMKMKAKMAAFAQDEFSKIMTEVSSTYFSALREAVQTGAATQAQMQAIQMTQSMGYQSTAINTTSAAMGGVVGAAFGNPLAGVAVGSGIGGAINSYQQNQMSIELIQLQQMSQIQQAASYSSYMTSGMYGTAGQLSSQFANMVGGPNGLAIGASEATLMARWGGNPYAMVSPTSIDALRQSSVSAMMPYGDMAQVDSRISGYAQLNSYFPGTARPGVLNTSGLTTSTTYQRPGYSDVYAQASANLSAFSDADRRAAYTEAARKTGVTNYDSGVEAQDGLSDWNDIESVNQNAHGFTRAYVNALQSRAKGTPSTKISDSAQTYALSRVYGGETYSALIRAGVTQEAAEAALSGFNAYETETYRGQHLASQSEIAGLSGDYGGQSALMRQSADTLRARRDAAMKFADGPGGERFAAEASRLDAAIRSQHGAAADLDFAAAGKGVAINSAYSVTAMRDYAMYGDTGRLGAGYERQYQAAHGESARINARLSAGNFSSPQEETSLRRELIESIQREKTVRDEGNRAIDQSNTRLASSVASSAISVQQRAFTLGVGGAAGGGLAANTYAQMGNLYQQKQQNAQRVYGQLQAQGMTDSQIQGNPVYQQAVSESNGAYAGAAQAYAGLGQVPNSVGLRREYSQDSYEFNIMQIIPGAMGNIYGAGRRKMNDLTKMQSEDDSTLALYEKRGLLSGDAGDALREQFQSRKQQRGLEYAGVMSELAVNWSGRLMSEVINAPDRAGYISPQMSMRAAVGAGVRNPAFGSSEQNAGGQWFSGMQFGSMAGGTGTPQGMATTLLSGGGVSDRVHGPGVMRGSSGGGGGVVISGTIKINGDGTGTLTGTMNKNDAMTRSSMTDGSASGISEMLNSFSGGRTH